MQPRRVEVTVTTSLGGIPANMLRPAVRRPQLRDTYAAYQAEGLTGMEIAAALGISKSMVYADLKELGMSRGRGALSENARRRQAAGLAVRAQRQRAEVQRQVAEGKRTCPRCGAEKDLEAGFGRSASKPTGHRSWCRDCEHADGKERSARQVKVAQRVESGRKTCSRCRQEKDRDDFHGDAKAPDGLYGWCKTCVADAGRERKERQQAGQAERKRTPAGQEVLQRFADELGLDLDGYEQWQAEQQAKALAWRAPATAPPGRDWCCTPAIDGSHDRSCPMGRVAVR